MTELQSLEFEFLKFIFVNLFVILNTFKTFREKFYEK